MSRKSVYKKVLVKISGEMLAGDQKFGLDQTSLNQIAEDLKAVKELNIEVGVVVGGGNIFRGTQAEQFGMERTNSDYMGMLATCINALALQDILEQMGVSTRVMSAIQMSAISEPYIRRRALRHLKKDRLVIFAGGTGNPYFSTDTAAALRAMEIQSEVLLKATKVDGVFSSDPNNSDATKFDEISYIDVLNKGLKIMDSTAVSLCMDNKLPLIAFNLNTKGNLSRVVCGEKVGTLIH